jgi:hypothetical protein
LNYDRLNGRSREKSESTETSHQAHLLDRNGGTENFRPQPHYFLLPNQQKRSHQTRLSGTGEESRLLTEEKNKKTVSSCTFFKEKYTALMHLLIKGYYVYKNLGDELIIFPLLTRI